MKILKLLINGKVPVYKSTRYCQKNGKLWAYDPNNKEKKRFQKLIKEQLPDDFKLIEGPVGLVIRHYLKIPKSRKNKVSEGTFHVVRPDETNLDKFVEDLLTGIIISDDKQVCCRPGKDFKIYSENPRVELELWIFEDEKLF